MLQKQTITKPADNSGVSLARVVHLYYGHRKVAGHGYMARVVAQAVYVRKKKRRFRRKKFRTILWYGSRRPALIIRTVVANKHIDNSTTRFMDNATAICNKYGYIRSRKQYGICDETMGRTGWQHFYHFIL